ncbi:MAG: pitrilysin family protein [Patescibacteria group bacterium]|jgi:predicted Zn-dependent peptidase
MYQAQKLKNGVNMYVVPLPSTETVTVLVLVRAGSKYETKRTNGLSHFLEHMFFKGTKKRPTPRAVAEVLDNVGGEYNAFTDKERTGYYAKVDARHLATAVDWVADMLLHSTFDAAEIEREKGVIHQELAMYYDTPTSYIDDVFEALLYGDQPAGWDIGGTRATVAGVTRRDLMNYLNRRYVGSATTIVVAGNVASAKAKRIIERAFNELKRGQAPDKPRVRERQTRPGIKLHVKATDQSHLMLGVRAVTTYDKRRYAAALLATILGGNMSSRLFTSLREEQGLAYYVSTSPQHYTDTGYLVTNAGVPNNKLAEAVTTIMKEYELTKREPVGAQELLKAKEYIKGKSLIGLESSSAVASFVGNQALLYKKAESIDVFLKKIDRVTAREVQALAQEIFRNDRLNLALIAPKGQDAIARPQLRFR